MIIYLFIGALSLIVGIVNSLTDQIDLISYITYPLSAVIFALCTFLIMIQARSYKQLDWLKCNSERLTDQPKVFEDSPFGKREIERSTVLRNYNVVLSFVIITTEDPLGYQVGGEFFLVFVSTVWNLTLGLWAIPLGPIATVHNLYRNFSGGEKVTIGEFLDKNP